MAEGANDVRVGGGEADQGESGDSKKKPTSPAKKKLLRMLTVMVYLTSITSGAFILALYYIFLWEPKRSNHNHSVHPHRLIQEDTGLEFGAQYHTVSQRSAETPRVLPIQESFMPETTTQLPFNFSGQLNSSDYFDF
ncbi:uncharacterized protein LOC111044743 isoform X2 [Nilaparvata lugens]|uniref:uncharacterized protein LOC111044743 isoform X2 n=1 Tax=Nilaparvata lugens TaxID=108931 RepID=UPI00193D8AEC|nr:uncharacterized protein LOC111044743 isoform X2 [Nilaparvata lugens]XP_039281514.1 uncharacterized protein LOC111044743 isoform X2 [Nilaparvata lugens]XP_039281515.1 uncharacterized protein LOC111044743 isoform X2 [Nilaparvata lugens]XP_039281516.1 uncharacterized protein LOC111044743 isoform X2 [Nilaparvata lugens]XP_039281517.1 uncharacterized protein LOC111044743 isoform X2 [Nilaparvata lugens]